MYSVSLSKIVAEMGLINITPEIDLEAVSITLTDINRPALQLTGFYDYFDSDRIQIIGKVEHTYLEEFSSQEREKIFERLFSYEIPCIIFSRDLEIYDEILKLALKHNIPILKTDKTTSYFMSELIRLLKVELAPRISIHGVLVDVYGEGVLIMGESGIGKSEAALELIKRGHRLVADDVVEIKKVSDKTLLGSSPDIIQHFIELRGIGIVDCKMLFGVESVKEQESIDLVIKLEEWSREKEYDRLGLEEEYIDILENKVVCHSIPIRPGRNLAIIVEAAAINHRQKSMGYNAAIELNNRIMGNLEKRTKEREEQEKEMR